MASQITGVSIVCLDICSGADQRKHQSSASLVFVRESTGHQWILDMDAQHGPLTWNATMGRKVVSKLYILQAFNKK